jgi:integrase
MEKKRKSKNFTKPLILPARLLKVLKKNDVWSFNTPEARAKAVADTFVELGYRASTATRYFLMMQNRGVFGFKTPLTINTLAFNEMLPQQHRIPSPSDFEKFINFCFDICKQSKTSQYYYTSPIMEPSTSFDYIGKDPNITLITTHTVTDTNAFLNAQRKYKKQTTIVKAIAIVFSYLTGLRLAEVCAITNKHLIELANRIPALVLKRKTTDVWSVIYYKEFEEFIDTILIPYYTKIINVHKTIEIRLVDFNKRTLQYAIRDFFYEATGVKPPTGFGIHTFRYLIATKLATNKKNGLENARIMLGHKNIRTTNRYVRHGALDARHIFETMYKEENLYKNLSQIFDREDNITNNDIHY